MDIETEPSDLPTTRRELMAAAGALAATGAAAGEARAAAPDSLGHPVPIRTIDPQDESYDDLEPFGDAVADARIVQLGEFSHGSGSGFSAKARLVKFLHARMGFDVLVWESGLHAMRGVNAGLRAGLDSVTSAQRGIFTIWSAAAEVKPLLDYAKACQAGPRPLEMAGFDCQFTARGADQALVADLWNFVEKLRDPALRAETRADTEAAVAAYAKVVARSATEADLRAGEAAIDRLLAAMESRRPAFARAHGSRELGFMARALESLRVFMALTFDTLPKQPGSVSAQSKNPTGFFNLREVQNAGNLRWLVEHGYPGRKLIVWAHNVHVARAAFAAGFASLRRHPRPGDMTPMGLSVARWFGKDVYTMALTSFAGEDRWVTGKAAAISIPAARPGSLEVQLHQLRQPYVFLDTRRLHPAERRLSLRVFAPTPGSATANPDGTFAAPVLDAFDGVFFIDQALPATRIED